jgi:hypothetical protein
MQGYGSWFILLAALKNDFVAFCLLFIQEENHRKITAESREQFFLKKLRNI